LRSQFDIRFTKLQEDNDMSDETLEYVDHDCGTEHYGDRCEFRQCDTCGRWWKCVEPDRRGRWARWRPRPSWWAKSIERSRHRKQSRKQSRMTRRIEQFQAGKSKETDA